MADLRYPFRRGFNFAGGYKVPSSDAVRSINADIVFWEVPGPVTHAATGALAGSGSTVAGVSFRFRVFSSTGELAGTAANLTGSSVYSVSHAASGELRGQGAGATGSAARFRQFATTGALTGQTSAVAGAAARSVTHAATGTLSGSASQITSGALIGTIAVQAAGRFAKPFAGNFAS